jgi:hypothetical protein
MRNELSFKSLSRLDPDLDQIVSGSGSGLDPDLDPDWIRILEGNN